MFEYVISPDTKLKKIFIFLLNSLVYGIPLAILSRISYPEFYSLRLFLAHVVSSMLNVVGVKSSVEDTYVLTENTAFLIGRDCSGYKSLLFFFLLVFSVPKKDFKLKLKIFIVFSPLVFLINIVRIFSSIYLVEKFKLNVSLVHDVFWAIIQNILIILLVWLGYKKLSYNK